MERVKKFINFVLPIAIVVAMSLSVCLPLSFAQRNRSGFVDNSGVEQIVYAATDTGAATAARDYKGGAIFLEPECTFDMSAGTISSHTNTYGGAVYISNGATFTMTGGTISSNTATYGGAIYIENGGKCILKGGTITANKASVAPAIFVESGGILEISGTAKIEKNECVHDCIVSAEKEKIGGVYQGVESSVELYTTTFGSYPQTYVGDDRNATLESWFAANQPKVEKTYTTRSNSYNTTGTWSAYKYLDGEFYARGQSYRQADGYTFKKGASVPADGTYVWFKVEPIKWYILNYDAWQSGSEKMELFSSIVLTGNIYFNATQAQGSSWETSYIRNWCNETFYNEAFTKEEQSQISLETIKNNATGNYGSEDSDGKATSTEDHIFLKSYYEMASGLFTMGTDEPNGCAARLCASSDFALSNYAVLNISNTTTYRSLGTCGYWERSCGVSTAYACGITKDGGVHPANLVDNVSDYGVRPALRLNIKP